ncbi:MAG: glycosyltransferase family 4 protein [Phycisphaeraceae bacterium]|nr:glycosyltransferase family 4 protein [Phycisphaeraceae bacterium]
MRITFINQFYKPDVAPTGQLTAGVAEHFAKLGHDVTVIASRGGYVEQPEQAQSSLQENLHVCRIWTPRLGKGSTLKRCIDYLVFYVMTFLRMLTLRRQDVVIAMTTPPYIAWAGATHKMLHRRCKLMLWNMDCYPEVAELAGAMKTGGLLAKVMYWANRRLFNRLDHLICLDQAMAGLLAHYHAKRDESGKQLPVTVIPNWERLADYPPDAGVQQWQGVDDLGLGGRFVVLYMGNMGFGHGFDTVLEAAEQLKDEPVTFLFIGGGKRQAEVAEQAKARGLSHVITRPYLPWEQVPQAMAAGSCALITLRDDMLGVMSPSKVHANLAAGLPILYVGPKGSNVDEAVTQFDCGLSTRHGQADPIVGFIRSLMASPDKHRALRGKARAAFDSAYNDRQALRRFEAVLAAS